MAKNNKKRGFTLAEVLATLAVISAIAAFIIPSVVADHKQVSEKIQKKVFAANFHSAMRNLSMLDGGLHKSTNARDFVSNHLTKTLKLAKICETDHIQDCGWDLRENNYFVPTADDYIPITLPTNSSDLKKFITLPTGQEEQMVAALTLNGVSMLIAYNNLCGGAKLNLFGHEVDKPCVNVIYDINGTGLPNRFGEDIGTLTIFGTLSPKAGAPILYSEAPYVEQSDVNTGRQYCHKFLRNKELDVLTKLEAVSLNINDFSSEGESGVYENALTHEDTDGGVAVCVYR